MWSSFFRMKSDVLDMPETVISPDQPGIWRYGNPTCVDLLLYLLLALIEEEELKAGTWLAQAHWQQKGIYRTREEYSGERRGRVSSRGET